MPNIRDFVCGRGYQGKVFLVILPKAVNRSDCISFPAGSGRVSGGVPGAGLGSYDGCACGARDCDSGPGAGGRRIGVNFAGAGHAAVAGRRGAGGDGGARRGRVWQGSGVAGVCWDAGIAVFLQYVPSSLNSWSHGPGSLYYDLQSCNHWSQQQAAVYTHIHVTVAAAHISALDLDISSLA
jgi:hypothetical protein